MLPQLPTEVTITVAEVLVLASENTIGDLAPEVTCVGALLPYFTYTTAWLKYGSPTLWVNDTES